MVTSCLLVWLTINSPTIQHLKTSEPARTLRATKGPVLSWTSGETGGALWGTPLAESVRLLLRITSIGYLLVNFLENTGEKNGWWFILSSRACSEVSVFKWHSGLMRIDLNDSNERWRGSAGDHHWWDLSDPFYFYITGKQKIGRGMIAVIYLVLWLLNMSISWWTLIMQLDFMIKLHSILFSCNCPKIDL